MSDGDDEVASAVRRLLQASQDFTRAYEAWVESPRRVEAERRHALEDAEKQMSRARDAVVFAQLRKH